MSSTAETAMMARPADGGAMGLWMRQIGAVLRIETRKNLMGLRAALVYVLASLPIGLLLMMALFGPTARQLGDPGKGSGIFAFLYEGLILRAVIFFGCAWIFMNLFRGEIVDRSLHYYLLSAIRREVLVTGKYLAGLVASIVLFGGATLVCLTIYLSTRGVSGAVSYVTSAQGFGQIAGYLGVTVLACVGYGALFLGIGLFFKNPIFPALVVYGWEFINFLLPPVLKKISVIHYLQSLSPVPVPDGPFAILAEPTPAWIAVPGFIVMTALMLAVSGWRIRTLEIRYGGE